jgi:DNA-binding HxlR family transcriptional regulator
MEPGINTDSGNCRAVADVWRIGDKWTVYIVGLLSKDPCASMNTRAVTAISQRMLSRPPARAERDGTGDAHGVSTIPTRRL